MPRPSSPRPSSTRPSAADVDALLAALAHPRTPTIQALRSLVRAVDPRIVESVKWNAPSFATTEHFATFHLRDPDAVQVVLHLGARPRPDAGVRAGVADPEQLLTWRGADRATATFRDVRDVEARADAFAAVLRQWIVFVS